MRMGNPSMRRVLRRAESGEMRGDGERASYGGIAKKSLVYLAITVVAALAIMLTMRAAVSAQNEALLSLVLVLAFSCAVPMLIISFVVAFIPKTVTVLGFVYCLLQGVLLGVLVYFVDTIYPGVALAAVMATMIVFAVAVVLNRVLEVRVSNKFVRGLIIAFASLLIVEVVLMILSAFISDLSVLFSGEAYLWIQLGISAFCVFYATIMLMWDLQIAENVVSYGADKNCEWQVAFSLITTLVYLYIEILDLILRVVALFGSHDN